MGENIELAHDSLADLIDKQRSDQQRQLNEIKRRIQYSFDEFQKSGDYLSRRQLNTFEEYIPALRLEKDVKDFIESSRQYVIGKEQEELARQRRELELTQQKLAAEQRAKKRQRGYLIIVAIIAVVAFVLGIWAYQQRLEAVEANSNLEKQVLATTFANIFAFRNEGKYKEAMDQIESFRTLFQSMDTPLDTQRLILQQIVPITVQADSLIALPDSLLNRERHLLGALQQYERANQISSDANLRTKIDQTKAEMERLFEDYKESGIGLYKYGGGCKQARPVLEKAELLKPGDKEVNEILRKCR